MPGFGRLRRIFSANIIEVIFGVVGLALVVYSIFAIEQRAYAVEQMMSQASQHLAPEVSSPAPQLGDTGERVHLGSPNFTNWSTSRIESYNSSFAGGLPIAAILQIPAIDLSAPVVPGTTDAVLNVAAGHIAATAGIGEPGNMAIAAHRDSYFRRLGELRVGDTIDLVVNGETWTYKTRAHFVVDPQDTFVLNPTPSQTITLITCYPFYYVGAAPERYIVQGELISAPAQPGTLPKYPNQTNRKENRQ